VRVLEADARAIGPAELLRAAAGGREEEQEEELKGLEGLEGEIEDEQGAGEAKRRARRAPSAPSSSSAANSALLPFDAVLSDMLHFTSGAGAVDVARSLELAGTALHAAVGYHYDEAERSGGAEAVAAVERATGVPRHSGLLRPGGSFVVKVYEGSGVDDWLKDARGYFERVVRLRVAASRSMSREFYAVGLARKSLPRGAPPLACDLGGGGGGREGVAVGSGAASGDAPRPVGDARGEPGSSSQRARRPGAGAAGGGGRRRAAGSGGGERPPPATPPPAEAPPSEWW
jgi:23S rRNA U2552 (ribose-2'-O)-methylase RlmE/FtsJ